jgi:hypothetical protein
MITIDEMLEWLEAWYEHAAPHVPGEGPAYEAIRARLVESEKQVEGTEFLLKRIKILKAQSEKERGQVRRLREALGEISLGRGSFSIDPIEHAKNCVAEMKETAKAALAETEEEK